MEKDLAQFEVSDGDSCDGEQEGHCSNKAKRSKRYDCEMSTLGRERSARPSVNESITKYLQELQSDKSQQHQRS